MLPLGIEVIDKETSANVSQQRKKEKKKPFTDGIIG